MDEFVRCAVTDDVSELVRLESEYRAALDNAVRGGAQWCRDNAALGADGWRDRVADEMCDTLVAGLDEVVFGFATMSLRVPNETVAVVEQLFVTQEARELGLGDDLVHCLAELAQARGAAEIEAFALPGDRQTKNLFERSGLVARLIIVSRSLNK